MHNITLEKYIEIFSNQSIIILQEGNLSYEITYENTEPILFFDNTAAIFKISDGSKFYALKCFFDNDDLKNGIYEDDYLKEKATENLYLLAKEMQLKDGDCDIKSINVLLAPWTDEVFFKNCNTRYIKELHQDETNLVYKKFRRKMKAGVATSLNIIIILILLSKYIFPNEIYINPIDYKKLIAADSIKTVNIALNKIKKENRKLNINEDIAGKSIFIKENSNEVFSILVPEPEKKDKPKTAKPKEVKKIILTPKENKKVTKQTKKLNDEEVKVIHSKSKVTFKKTEF